VWLGCEYEGRLEERHLARQQGRLEGQNKKKRFALCKTVSFIEFISFIL